MPQAAAEDRRIAPAPQGATVFQFYAERSRRGLPLVNRFQIKAAWLADKAARQ